MSAPRLWARLAAFGRGREGAVTVEFVIVFPAIIMLLMFIVFISFLIATLSDLQQVAHELARVGLRYGEGTTAAQICTALQAHELAGILARTASGLSAADLSLSCALNADPAVASAKILQVQVGYNYAGQAISDLGQSFGWPIGMVSRAASMGL